MLNGTSGTSILFADHTLEAKHQEHPIPYYLLIAIVATTLGLYLFLLLAWQFELELPQTQGSRL